MCYFIRDSTHPENVMLQSLGRENLIEENDDVQCDEKECNVRNAAGRILVFKRNEHEYEYSGI